MKFLCLFHFRPDAFAGVGPEEMRRIDDATIEHDHRMRQSGHLIFGSPLTGPDEMATIDRRRRLDMAVVDGPFTETKEVVGGFVLLEARDMDDALSVFADDPITPFARLEIRPLRSDDSDRHSQTGQGRPDLAID